MGLGDAKEGARAPAPGLPATTGELRCGGVRLALSGRTLRLVLWLAAHQTRVNETAGESGQLWLTWKGEGLQSVDGEIKTRL